jgi:hypothetical protein
MKISKDSQTPINPIEIKTGGGGTQTINAPAIKAQMVEIKTGGGGTQIDKDDREKPESKSVSATA